MNKEQYQLISAFNVPRKFSTMLSSGGLFPFLLCVFTAVFLYVHHRVGVMANSMSSKYYVAEIAPWEALGWKSSIEWIASYQDMITPFTPVIAWVAPLGIIGSGMMALVLYWNAE